jgi:DNA (cytosine-5)-methyltransferase 1
MIAAGLFAGIGGFEVGLRAAGIETALLCEIDPAAQAVLRREFPEAVLMSDVREVSSLPTDVEVLVAGFPLSEPQPSRTQRRNSEAPTLERLKSRQHPRSIPTRSRSTRFGWSSTRRISTSRSVRPSTR